MLFTPLARFPCLNAISTILEFAGFLLPHCCYNEFSGSSTGRKPLSVCTGAAHAVLAGVGHVDVELADLGGQLGKGGAGGVHLDGGAGRVKSSMGTGSAPFAASGPAVVTLAVAGRRGIGGGAHVFDALGSAVIQRLPADNTWPALPAVASPDI